MDIKTGLPIEEVLPEVHRALRDARCAVLEAPPGAGKTTVVPLALLGEKWLKERRVVVLEPRRLAARAAAWRMAELLGEEAGQTIGYRTRMDTRTGPATRVEVVTEGILTRLLQNDPALEGVGAVVFDEFHERSLQADLGLALTLETRAALREDLRVLVMSATLDGEEVASLLGGAPVIKSEGRTFPVEVRYLERPARPTGPAGRRKDDVVSKTVRAVAKVLQEEPGSVLVFLPGAGEIRRALEGLGKKALPPDVDVVPLYGMLSREDQDRAIRPPAPGRRKVVLATSIAETSLTIEGVRVVVDGGLMRRPRYSPARGMSTLETLRVARDSAEQRRGRAGRTGPGVCLRLWTEAEDRGLVEKNAPEITDADLAPLALELAAWGARPGELSWLDPPPDEGFTHAVETLKYLEAVDQEGRITPHGKEMAGLPLHPRLAHMVLKARGLGLGGLACLVSALISEGDIFKDRSDPDIRHRVECLLGKGPLPANCDPKRVKRVRAAARELGKRLGVKDHSADIEKTGLLLTFAYLDRVGILRPGSRTRYLLAGGRGATLPGGGQSPGEYIVAAELSGGGRESKVFLAAPVEEAELFEHFPEEVTESSEVVWDGSEQRVIARTRKMLGALVLSEKPLSRPPQDKVLEALLSGIREKGLGALPWTKKAENLRARITFLRRHRDETGVEFPDVSLDGLMDGLERWLGPWILGVTRLEELKGVDLGEAILGMLDWTQKEALERLAPESIKVPSGSGVSLDYTAGERPVLAVRVQEMFGLVRTPMVAGGRIKVLLHLLSPARRPVQVTDDLAGFWQNGYQGVKKDLKGRYPKHHWPDDPAKAEPVRGVKKRGQTR